MELEFSNNISSILYFVGVFTAIVATKRMPLSISNRRPVLIAIIFATISIIHIRHNIDLTSSFQQDGTPINKSLQLPSSTRSQQTLPLATAGYAISITACGPKLAHRLFDAAAVLKRSIELNSFPIHNTSKYAAKFYAFILKQPNNNGWPDNDKCYQILSMAGWKMVPQDPPLFPSLIQEPPGSILKMGIQSDGCCGDNELIKLATYKLLEHDFAIHLDLDTLVTYPLDELYDVMYFDHRTNEGRQARVQLAQVVAPTYINRRLTGNPASSGGVDTNDLVNTTTIIDILSNITVDAYFTKDYNMIRPGQESQKVGVQGGFLLVRPSMAVYSHLLHLVYSGEFYSGFDARTSGWFKKGYGRHIWGSMTIQGLMAYYFDVEQLETSVELNRCRYNNIADNARVSGFARNPKYPRCSLLPFIRNASNPRYNFDDKQCRDGRSSCDDTDCQRFPLAKSRVLHYTYCKAPWKCNGCEYLETYKESTCYAMEREWFRVRNTIPGEEGERNLADVKGDDKGPLSYIRDDGVVELREGNCYKEFFLGYCLGNGGYGKLLLDLCSLYVL